MSQVHFIALSGFLGDKSDWNHFSLSPLHAVDILDYREANFSSWAERFNGQIFNQTSAPRCLIGYSMGGRLALHALIQDPPLWDCAVIISAHPGLQNSQERRRRRVSDEAWAERFEHESWSKLLSAWNSQAVFQHSSSTFQRDESQFDRERLANLLRWGSLGAQDDLRETIFSIHLPILWLVGEGDEKFVQICSSLKFHHPLSKVVALPGCGHRVPWDEPALFEKTVLTFCRSIYDER